MTALPTTSSPSSASPSTAVGSTAIPHHVGVTATRVILLGEAVLALGVSIFLSLLASGMGTFSGPEAEITVRWASAAAFLLAVAAAIASRGVRRRRGWAWTTAAVVQLLIAVGTGVAVLNVAWHPAYLVGFMLPALAMLVLCTGAVRRELGQA